MNENIDLTKILKNCPRGFKLYSAVHGEVTFLSIENGTYPICVLLKNYNCTAYYSSSGKAFTSYGECVLFPSKDQRDWSKFTVPWLKKERFDPKMLNPFDKVLIRYRHDSIWYADLFSHYVDSNNIICVNSTSNKCIPYNDDTKHLIGTRDEAPEYYRYWED